MAENMTIEQLAAMIQNTTASKEDVRSFRVETNQRLGAIENRMERIEERILKDYGQRIEQLEHKVKELQECTGNMNISDSIVEVMGRLTQSRRRHIMTQD